MTASARRHALLLGSAFALLLGFFLLTSEMVEAETMGFDAAVLSWALNWRVLHPGGEAVMRDLSGLGSTVVLTMATVAAAAYLWIRKERLQAGLSFPSGHASLSAIFFLTMWAGRHVRSGERWFLMGSAIGCALLIGLSRIALGVHWTSDVLGGWAFGAGWAVLSLWIGQNLPRPWARAGRDAPRNPTDRART
jgi:undecaprenyl-diphosphatase